eukprot:gene17357-8945_t
MINKRKAREDRYVSRNLKREADLMQRLRHPHIVRLLEVMETDSFYYLVTELCTGGELLDLICERKYLDENTTRKYIQQLLSAVNSMHHSGVVHRDLKIENFLLDEKDNLKIVDFGLSNKLPSSALEAWERIGMCPLLLTTHCGSPAYAAPELLAQKAYGAQVDIWSIGVNMFAMLTGSLPYNLERFNIIDMYQKMMDRRMTPLPQYISQEARDLLMQFLDPLPETRITLEAASNHPWLRTSAKVLLRSGSLGSRLALEVNQDIALHMADNMGMSMKEVVNSVTQNRACHSFAIYYLLNERFKRYELQKRQKDKGLLGESSFAKVKVVRKAKLRTDVSPKSKFTYKGVKITKDGLSQTCIMDENGDNFARSDGESEQDLTAIYSSNDGWNQYATFPRDRRTSSSTSSKSNSNRLVNATLDKGSDDIDYQRNSSPETTDNSTSSLESAQILRNKLLNMETVDVSLPRSRSRKESGSDEEQFSRGRSKSLTGREEYDYSHNPSPYIGRSRALSIANSFHHMEAPSTKHAVSNTLKNNSLQFRTVISHPKSFKLLEADFKDFVIIERQEPTRENCHQKEGTLTVRDTHDLNLNKDTDNNSGKTGNSSHRKKGILRLNQTKSEEAKALDSSQAVNENFTEIIPPPTPFKDRDLKVNIELVQTRKAPSCQKEAKLVSKLERKTVSGSKSGSSHRDSRHIKGKTRSSGDGDSKFREGVPRSRRQCVPSNYGNESREVNPLRGERCTGDGDGTPLESHQQGSKGKNRTRDRRFSTTDVESRRHPPDSNHSSRGLEVSQVEGKKLKKIELEKVRKVALEPLRNSPLQIAPVLQTVSPFSLQSVRQETMPSPEVVVERIQSTTKPFIDLNNNEHVNNNTKDKKTGATRLESQPFKLNVVKLAKCQCIPVFRPEVVEPLQLKIGRKGVAMPLTSSKRDSALSLLKEAVSTQNPYRGSVTDEKVRRFVAQQARRKNVSNSGNRETLADTTSKTQTYTRDRRSRSLNEIDFLEQIERQEKSLPKHRLCYRTNSGGNFTKLDSEK